MLISEPLGMALRSAQRSGIPPETPRQKRRFRPEKGKNLASRPLRLHFVATLFSWSSGC
jgi:hypothetical protein